MEIQRNINYGFDLTFFYVMNERGTMAFLRKDEGLKILAEHPDGRFRTSDVDILGGGESFEDGDQLQVDRVRYQGTLHGIIEEEFLSFDEYIEFKRPKRILINDLRTITPAPGSTEE